MSDPQLFDDPTVRAPYHETQKPGRKKKTCTPDPIGSGPPGETCKTCCFKAHVKYHDKRYYKCGLMEHEWTHGAGSDIKLKWAACRSWEPYLQTRLEQLGDFAKETIEMHGVSRTSLLVIADYYDELGIQMDWLRMHVEKMVRENRLK